MKKLIIIALTASLLACTTMTPEERAAQLQQEVDEMIQVYGPACEKLGYRTDTDQWRECILKLNTSRAMERYSTRPTMTQCWGHRGFYQCSSF